MHVSNNSFLNSIRATVVTLFYQSIKENIPFNAGFKRIIVYILHHLDINGNQLKKCRKTLTLDSEFHKLLS